MSVELKYGPVEDASDLDDVKLVIDEKGRPTDRAVIGNRPATAEAAALVADQMAIQGSLPQSKEPRVFTVVYPSGYTKQAGAVPIRARTQIVGE